MNHQPAQPTGSAVATDRNDPLEAELEEERAHVAMLYGWLDRLRERARTQLGRAQRADGGRTHQAWVDRDALVSLHLGRLVQLSSVEHGLCLGRLDRRDGTRLYIGRLGLLDDDHEPLLVDWRAPAAEPFYRATPAAHGEVVRRRHFQTRGRLVTGFSDDVLDLDALGEAERGRLNGEAALLAALRAHRTGRMGDIVATIQAEQDRVIRSGLPGILVIDGGPGTGKTAVALHRAAYLLYTHRDRLARRGVLVVGPNPTFLRYIQQVLPSLGETGVLLATVEQLYPGARPTAAEPAATAALKGDLRMAGVLAAAVRDHQRTLEVPLELTLEGHPVRLDPETCERARTLARASGEPHNLARRLVVGEVVGALTREVADRVEADLRAVEELIDDSVFGPDEQLGDDPLLDVSQLTELAAEIEAAPEVRAVLDRLWPQLSPQQLLADLFASADRLAAAAPDLSEAERSLLLRVPEAGAAGTLTAADIPLLDEAAELLGSDDTAAAVQAARREAEDQRNLAYARGVLEIVGVDDEVLGPRLLADRYHRGEVLPPLAGRALQDRKWIFGHVIVDEAQELSAMAWRMLMRRCPSRSMTVAGDLAQGGAPWGASSWAEALDPHAAGHWRRERLTVNYRTPAEIMAVAAQVLAGADPRLATPTSVRETGTVPWRLHLGEAELADRLPAVIAAEAEKVGGGRLAVLVPTAQAGALGRRIVAALPELAVASGPEALDAPVAVLTVAEARGLEFDGVVVLEPGAIVAESPKGVNNLYVALTRATQRLGVVHSTALPEALARLAPLPG